jgi:hypothetical protein
MAGACVAPASPPVSPRRSEGAEQLSTANLMAEKAAKLDRDTFGVAVGQGPCVAAVARGGDRRHAQAAGLWSVWGRAWGPASKRSLLAWRNEGRMRWRIGIPSKTARRQSGCRCSTCGSAGGLLRCGGRKRRSSLVLGRLKYALPGWEEAESRRAADTATEASWRSHASGSGGGLGGDSSWGDGYGGDVGRVDRQ